MSAAARAARLLRGSSRASNRTLMSNGVRSVIMASRMGRRTGMPSGAGASGAGGGFSSLMEQELVPIAAEEEGAEDGKEEDAASLSGNKKPARGS
jgi:hypothetical protein